MYAAARSDRMSPQAPARPLGMRTTTATSRAVFTGWERLSWRFVRGKSQITSCFGKKYQVLGNHSILVSIGARVQLFLVGVRGHSHPCHWRRVVGA